MDHHSTEMEVLSPDAPPLSEDMERGDVITIFNAFKPQVEKLKETALSITVTDANDTAGMMLARETRIALWRIEVAVEKRRKELKASSIARGRKIEAAANELKKPLGKLIERLEEQENFAKREKEKEESLLREERTREIAAFSGPLSVDYGKMPEDEYQRLRDGAKVLWELEQERQKEEEKTRADAERARQVEQMRMRAENDRLRREADDLREQQLKAAQEKERLQREITAREAEANRLRQAEASRIAAEQMARIKQDEEARCAAMAPIADKLRMYAAAIPIPPSMNDATTVIDVTAEYNKFVNWLKAKADSLSPMMDY